MNAYDEYMKQIVVPMRQELTQHGFKELISIEEVNEHMTTAKGTSFIVINSVCGCAAGLARPAAIEAISQLEVKPEHLVTVFAGQDADATAQMREYFADVPPSSPSMAIWKDGELAYFIPREQIENHPKDAIKEHIQGALSQIISS
ncbi:BrxA/BrxB family bacilliredoxin [Chryseomicrobium palamuruense]|uniref:BrxA/BrxB family bacilliredoxin n=1 Tax=Chryseomicrobium palamuruense TaxID=682973 RepID=A0ABV8UTK5_9BACL